MIKTAVIMAGGHGERFWPKSRINMPKQFLSLTNDGKTMLQLTVERLLPVVNMENIYIVTNDIYIHLVATQLPNLPIENILAEPQAKNTAPCIALAAAIIGSKHQESIMIVVPSDHMIKNIPLFTDILIEASNIAEIGDNIVTIGITPNYPETGYGYIHFNRDKSLQINSAYKVKNFIEKPSLKKAEEYMNDGCYLWNSGMFVWKLSTIVNNLKLYLPLIYESMCVLQSHIYTENIAEIISQEYSQMPAESIDYGVMEKAKNIYTIPGSFGWDDVGSWLAVERINKTDNKGNYIKGNIISLETENSLIISKNENMLVATIGINDLIIVIEDDAILICNKDNAQDVKKVVAKLKNNNALKYL